MKNILSIIGLASLLFLSSCSKDDVQITPNEVDNFQLAVTLNNGNHKVEVYTPNGKFQTGYNAMYLQVKNMEGSFLQAEGISWLPVMHMMGMTHSCPSSVLVKQSETTSTYAGYLVFQMAGNDSEYWTLSINYTVNGKAYAAEDKIAVTEAARRSVESFEGTDHKRYVLAMADPASPRVAVNDMTAVLYRMESMMSFVPVTDCKIKIDPRMPGMGNHSSPNNVDLKHQRDGLYSGKLSLTMTGYWKINLQLESAAGELLKGEAVSPENESSSIYFELEF